MDDAAPGGELHPFYISSLFVRSPTSDLTQSHHLTMTPTQAIFRNAITPFMSNFGPVRSTTTQPANRVARTMRCSWPSRQFSDGVPRKGWRQRTAACAASCDWSIRKESSDEPIEMPESNVFARPTHGPPMFILGHYSALHVLARPAMYICDSKKVGGRTNAKG